MRAQALAAVVGVSVGLALASVPASAQQAYPGMCRTIAHKRTVVGTTASIVPLVQDGGSADGTLKSRAFVVVENDVLNEDGGTTYCVCTCDGTTAGVATAGASGGFRIKPGGWFQCATATTVSCECSTSSVGILTHECAATVVTPP